MRSFTANFLSSGVELNTNALVQWLVNVVGVSTQGKTVAGGIWPESYNGCHGFIIAAGGHTFEVGISVKRCDDTLRGMEARRSVAYH